MASDEWFTAEAGSLVVIPRDVPHQFRNAGDVPARALMIFRPGGFDELIGEMREAAAAGTVDEKQRRKSAATGRGVPAHGTSGAGHVAFAAKAEDLEAGRKQLRQAGISIEREVDWPEGGRSIYFRDPAGNVLELAPPTIWGGGWQF